MDAPIPDESEMSAFFVFAPFFGKREQHRIELSRYAVHLVQMYPRYPGEIDAIIRAFDPDPNKQLLIAALQSGLPLHGLDVIATWRTQTDEYPTELARAVVNRDAQIDHFWRIAMWRERGDPTGVHGKIVAVRGAILHVLLAINRVYYFGVKHRDTLIAQLELAPSDLARRMDACFDSNGPADEETLRRLVEDVYDLIERHVPGIDVERLRRIFRYRRPLWDAMPPAGL